MNCKFINVLAFAAGAVVGSLVTWKVVKDRYERIVQEEIDSVKEAFADMHSDSQEQHGENVDEDAEQLAWEALDEVTHEEPQNDYKRLVEHYDKEGGGEDMPKEPRVISPLDYDTDDDYKTVELTYYADGILEDEDGSIVEDVDELLGVGALDTFGDYEDDAIYVRNDYLMTDIAVLKDYRTYEEARSITSPRRVYDE